MLQTCSKLPCRLLILKGAVELFHTGWSVTESRRVEASRAFDCCEYHQVLHGRKGRSRSVTQKQLDPAQRRVFIQQSLAGTRTLHESADPRSRSHSADCLSRIEEPGLFKLLAVVADGKWPEALPQLLSLSLKAQLFKFSLESVDRLPALPDKVDMFRKGIAPFPRAQSCGDTGTPQATSVKYVL